VTRPALAFGAVLLAAALVACGGSEAYRLDGGIRRRGLAPADVARKRALVVEGDRLWLERADPRRLAGALNRWERAVALDDTDWAAYTRLARGYFFQADAVLGFLATGGRYPFRVRSMPDPLRARYRAAHRRGFIAALRGMAARSRELEQRLAAGIDMARAVRVLDRGAAPLLYWYVANLGRWAAGGGAGLLLNTRSAVIGSLEHLRRIDPAYFHGGADRLLGVYYAVAPAFVGGDLGKSRSHFDAALRAGPDYLANAVLAAEFLDRKTHDRAAFEGRLRRVLTSRVTSAPDLAPENDLERRKARALLDRAESYFKR
jgi:hypothetical protein